MQTILRILKQAGGWHHGLYLKIENPPYMALVIEATDESGPCGLPAISVVSLRRTERRPHARPGDVFRAWIHRRATPERLLLPKRLCRRGAVEPHHSSAATTFTSSACTSSTSDSPRCGTTTCDCRASPKPSSSNSRPHAPKPFPAPERMGKRVRSTTLVQCNRSRRAAMQDSSAIPISSNRHHSRIHHQPPPHLR